MRNLCAVSALLLVAGATAATAQVTLEVGSATIGAGGSGTIDIVLNAGSSAVAGTENELDWDAAAIQVGDCTVNEAIDKTLQKTFRPADPACTPGTDCESFKGIIINFSDLSPIADGSVLYTCNVSVAADAAPGEYPVNCTLPGSSDPDGNSFETACNSGTITVPEEPQVQLALNMIEAIPGGTATLEISLDVLKDVEVAGTENELAWNPGELAVSNCVVNEAINKDLQSTFRPADCAEGVDCNEFKGIIINFSDLSAIEDGSLLYSCDVGIAGGTSAAVLSGAQQFTIACNNPGSSNPDGESLLTICNDAVVNVVDPTPTPTATNTPTEEPTATEGMEETPTPEPTDTPEVRPTNTRIPVIDDDSCQIVAPASSSLGWILMMPAAVLFRLRRRNR
jgi:hypothetical protein